MFKTVIKFLFHPVAILIYAAFFVFLNLLLLFGMMPDTISQYIYSFINVKENPALPQSAEQLGQAFGFASGILSFFAIVYLAVSMIEQNHSNQEFRLIQSKKSSLTASLSALQMIIQGSDSDISRLKNEIDNLEFQIENIDRRLDEIKSEPDKNVKNNLYKEKQKLSNTKYKRIQTLSTNEIYNYNIKSILHDVFENNATEIFRTEELIGEAKVLFENLCEIRKYISKKEETFQFNIFSNKQLIEISKKPSIYLNHASYENLFDIKIIYLYGDFIIHIIKHNDLIKTLEIIESYYSNLESDNNTSSGNSELQKKLVEWRKAKSYEFKIDKSKILLNKQIKKICLITSNNNIEKQLCEILTESQYWKYGEELKKLV